VDLENPEYLRVVKTLKNIKMKRKNSNKKITDAHVNVSILNAIKQFKSADEMKRRKGGNEGTPIKSGRFNHLNDINEDEKRSDDG
jgi:hypothetical protein